MAGLSNRTVTGTEAASLVSEWFAKHPTASSPRLIQWLDDKGFVIVQKPYRKPARRGNRPKPYTGPAMIGTSHSAKLAG